MGRTQHIPIWLQMYSLRRVCRKNACVCELLWCELKPAPNKGMSKRECLALIIMYSRGLSSIFQTLVLKANNMPKENKDLIFEISHLQWQLWCTFSQGMHLSKLVSDMWQSIQSLLEQSKKSKYPTHQVKQKHKNGGSTQLGDTTFTKEYH